MGATLVRPEIYVAVARPFVNSSPGLSYELWRTLSQKSCVPLNRVSCIDMLISCPESKCSEAQISAMINLFVENSKQSDFETLGLAQRVIITIALMSRMKLCDKLRFVFKCFEVQVRVVS
jgi:hypothetical protein